MEKDEASQELAVRWVSVDQVKPYRKNTRAHSTEAVEKLAKLIVEFGWRQPIVVDEQFVIIMGHRRLLAAKSLDLGTVPVHVATGLSKDQVRALRLADNRVSRDTIDASDVLREELRELEAAGYDLGQTGFEDDEVSAALTEEAERTDSSTSAEDLPLRWPNKKIPISREEAEALDALLEAHLRDSGLVHGFVRRLLDGG